MCTSAATLTWERETEGENTKPYTTTKGNAGKKQRVTTREGERVGNEEERRKKNTHYKGESERAAILAMKLEESKCP